MGLIHRGGKLIRLSKAGERFAPGTLMRGCEQDAVNVENARGQPLRVVGPGSRWFADSHEATHSGQEKASEYWNLHHFQDEREGRRCDKHAVHHKGRQGHHRDSAVAKHELIEIIRTTKDRVPLRDALLTGGAGTGLVRQCLMAR
jgi:hypothetical protein